MRITRRPVLTLLVVAALAAAWVTLRSGEREIVVLRAADNAGRDSFTTLWVVDDPSGFLWVRAHRPDRKWLPLVEQRPDVQLRRAGRTQTYTARIFDDDATRAYVAPLFRAKYGLADRWREWTDGREPIPVRLQAR